MAKLSNHGTIIGTVNFTTSAKRYMSDGHILKNCGFGWKLYAKCKVSPVQSFESQKAAQEQFLAARPATAEYRRILHDMAGMSLRWKLHAAVQLMPDDFDGVWSETCDGYGDNVSASVDEVAELCRAYQRAMAEKQAHSILSIDACQEVTA